MARGTDVIKGSTEVGGIFSEEVKFYDTKTTTDGEGSQPGRTDIEERKLRYSIGFDTRVD